MTASASGVITIVARNYLSRARVLASTLRDTNPHVTLTALVVDAEGSLPEDEDSLHFASPADLPLTRLEFEQMAVIYEVTELCTALKPWALSMMLERVETAAYLDPDIAVFGSLDPVLEIPKGRAIVLTPHCVEPIPRDGLRPSEADLAAAGVYNLGFVAVNRDAEPMLEWWAERLRRDCLVAFDRQMFVDQRWMDQAPALFPCEVVVDPGCNVAYWNLHERDLRRVGDRLMIGDVPLRFFHFSGLEPERPWVISKYVVDKPRVVLSEYSEAAALCDWYLEQLADASALDSPTYAFDRLPDGTRLTGLMRTVYRDAILRADEGLGELPPPVFGDAADARAIQRWFVEPLEPGAPIGRLLEGLWRHRADLQHHFPHAPGRDGAALTVWAGQQAEFETGIPLRYLVRDALAPADLKAVPPASEAPGANVSGYLTAALGIGQIGRSVVDIVANTGLPVATRAFTATSSRLSVPQPTLGRFGEHPVNIVVVNADQFPMWCTTAGADVMDGRYTIGVWFWELAYLPSYFSGALDLVDEVWVASAFARRALKAITDKPVHVLPVALTRRTPPRPFDRERHHIPDRPMFLFMFDYFSTIERKNPGAVVDAFCEAFDDGEGPILVIKTINGDKTRSDRERLRFRTRGRSDIFLLEDYLDPEENDALLADAQCYVSLHRSEGFGLTLAESMLYGVPVIATSYSGNMDFVSAANSLLVDYSLVPVPPGAGPYPEGASWAEPDVHMAAAHMRRVYDEPEWARALGARGREDVLRVLSMEAATQFVRKRVVAATAVTAARRRAETAVGSPAVLVSRHARVMVDLPPALDTPSRYPAIARAWRSLAFRALRHHDEQEHLRLAAVADAGQTVAYELDRIRGELGAARADATRQSGVARADIEAISHELMRQARLRRDIEQLAARIDKSAEVVGHLQQFQVDAIEAIAQLRDMQQAVEGDMTEWSDALSDLAARVATLKDRVRADPYRSDPDALRIVDSSGTTRMGYVGNSPQAYIDFEQIFRGSSEFVGEGMKPYVDLLLVHAPVADLGCGRGEMLGLLREHGIAAYGVDTDDSMLAAASAAGLDVRNEDLFEHLAGLADGSLGGVVTMQVAEHLPVERLRTLFVDVRRVLRSGGVFILETVNPHAVDAFRSFWLDLTHVRPLFPEAMLMLAGEAGFPRAEIMFSRGSGDLETDLDEQGAYALVAWAPGGGD